MRQFHKSHTVSLKIKLNETKGKQEKYINVQLRLLYWAEKTLKHRMEAWGGV